MMRTITMLVLLVSAMLCGGAVGGAEYATIFARTPDLRPPYFSTLPEMIKQRRAQFQAILERIHLVDQGKGAASFGVASNGLQLALIVLEPELASTQRVHAAIVLRNDSSEKVGYQGDTTDVLEIIAVDEASQPLPRTPSGKAYAGRRVNVGIGKPPTMVIPAHGQVVYEVNLAELFVVPRDKRVTFVAAARFVAGRGKGWAEVHSQSGWVWPRGDAGVKSFFDEPEAPEWVLARMRAYQETSGPVARSNAVVRMAQDTARPTNFVFSSSTGSSATNPFPQTNLTNASPVVTGTPSVPPSARQSPKADLLQPPAVGVTEPMLAPLLGDGSGRAATNAVQWQQRAALRQRWQGLLGEFPAERARLKSEVLATEELPDFTRQHVKYQIQEGVFTDAYLLTPKPARERRPAVVVFHQTVNSHARQAAGLDVSNPELNHGVQLVRRGYVVVCPRCYIFDDGTNFAGNVKLVQQRNPAWTGMARMTFDGVRAVDFLASLPSVDTDHIGALGHSLGAKEVLFAAAFDERYKVAVFSEGGIGLKFTNWDAPWYLGPAVRQAGFAGELHELLALIAPRGFLLLAGESADGDRSWRFIEAARPVYRLLGAEKNLGWLNHRQGHRYPAAAREVAEEFLDRFLKP